MMGRRRQIRDPHTNQQLKKDLIQHLWHKFGRDEDNNWVWKFVFEFFSIIVLIFIFIFILNFHVFNVIL